MPVLAGVFWGSVGVFVRTLMDFGMDNYTVLGSRMAVAVVILFFVILFRDKSLFRIRIRDPSPHRDRHDEIAFFSYQTADSEAFASDDNAYRPF